MYAISFCVPKIFNARFRLYARKCRLISVRTLDRVCERAQPLARSGSRAG
jgi:hypothetical protein